MTRRGPGVSYYAIRSDDKLRGILREVVTAHTRSLDLWTENGWIYSPWLIGSISGHGDDDAEPMGEPTPAQYREVLESRREVQLENRRSAEAYEASTASEAPEIHARPAPGGAELPAEGAGPVSRFWELLRRINDGTATAAELKEWRGRQDPNRFTDDPEFRVISRDPPTTLGTDEQRRLLMDVCLGRLPSIPGDEAERFYRKVAQEVERLVAQGFAIDIPFD